MEFLLELDGNILLWIQEYIRADWMTPFWRFITWFGNGGWFWIALGVLLMIPKKTRMAGVTVLIALAVGALITNVTLKNLVARTRPYEVLEGLEILIGRPHDFSFPSGHTCASFAAAFVCFRLLPRRYGIGALGFAALIAFSRLYLGVHYPTDILGGLLAGLAAAMIACRLMKRHISAEGTSSA